MRLAHQILQGHFLLWAGCLVLSWAIFSCRNDKPEKPEFVDVEYPATDTLSAPPPFDTVIASFDVNIGCWFDFMDSLGTKVLLRYDLEVFNDQSDTIRLKDIYGWAGKKKK